MEDNTGFIYRNKKGEFLLRIINRGHFDEGHYILKFVTVFEWGCLFYSEIILDDNDRDSLTKTKYRTLFSKEVIADCVCERVVVSGDAYNGFGLEVAGVSEFKEYHNANHHDGDDTFDDQKYKMTNGEDFDDQFVQDCFDHFKAGQQSQQSKIDELQKQVITQGQNFNDQAQKLKDTEYFNQKLQARIDEALRHVVDHGGYDDLTHVINILKGNKDEN